MTVHPHTWLEVLPLAAVGFAAGFLNVLAGGGSLLTLPVLLWLGMPAPVANATNRIGLVMQNVAATSAFHRRRRLPVRTTLWLFAAALPGAALGTVLALDIDEHVFRRVLLGVFVFVLWSMLRGGVNEKKTFEDTIPHPRWLAVSFFFMGFYAGFIQAGLGFLLIAALTQLGGFDLIRTNAVKVFFVLLVQSVSLAIFAAAGHVDWLAGCALALGSTLGAWSSAHWQMAKGSVWVRRAVLALLFVFTARLVQESFFHPHP